MEKSEKDAIDRDQRIKIFERILIYLGYIEKGGLTE